jgi:hypothetical protein
MYANVYFDRSNVIVNNKCIGCDKEATTKKGWCSVSCYRINQRLVQNSGRIKPGRKYTDAEKLQLSIWSKEWAQNNPDKVREIARNANRPEVNLKKGNKGPKHPKWITDRTKLKTKRCMYEEKEFFKEVLSERGYRCEITGKNERNLSVHHLDSVHLHPEKRFDKSNVIVITKDIHMDFHKKYGFQWATKEKWDNYVKETFGE